MASPLTRTAALILIIAFGSITLGAAGWAECAAGQAPSQAMMACCRDNPSCPMHEVANPGATSHEAMSHPAPADCCAASGAGDSAPPASAILVPVASAVAPAPPVSATLIAVPAAPMWRADAPLRPEPVARHILLSVFQI